MDGKVGSKETGKTYHANARQKRAWVAISTY